MAAPLQPRILTVEDWRALPEDSVGRTELMEGVLLVSPRPALSHAKALYYLTSAFARQLPANLIAPSEAEVLVNAASPPTIRIPDLVVCDWAVGGQTLSPSDIIVAIEIVSPSSRRMDHVTKRSEYSEVGIPHYWIVDLQLDRVELTALTLTAGAYVGEALTGTFTCDIPFPFELDLDSLRTPS